MEANSNLHAEVESLTEGLEASGGASRAGQNAKRGGWMPKVAQMMAAVYSKDWAYAEKLSNRFYEESCALAKLVDMKLRCKS